MFSQQIFAFARKFIIMDINERFEHIINTLYKGNKRAFALAIAISPSVVENVVGARRGKPSYDVIYTVCAKANISANWLIMGEGNMLLTTTDNYTTTTEVIYKSDPRDAEMIIAKNEMIETQKELISALKYRIKELERTTEHTTRDAFTSDHSVAPSGASARKTTK